MKLSFKNVLFTFTLSMLIIFNIKNCSSNQKLDNFQVEITDTETKEANVDINSFWVTKKSEVTLIKDQNMILITGPIEVDTATKFESLLTNDIDTVAISSPGGDVLSSVKIATKIHELGLDTFIPSNGQCFSGCTLIFQAGTLRVAYENTMFAYHSAKFIHEDGREQISVYGTATYWSYLMLFDINPELFELMPSMETDYFITAANSRRFNIVNRLIMLDK